MAKLEKLAGATSEIWQVFIQDSSSTTGAGLTGLAFNTASLTAYYHRDVDTTATAISLVTMTVGTFTSSGFKEVDATNMPGWYQFCPPNAALASGAKSCAFHLKGATNQAPLPIEVQLVSVNPDDATKFGMTRVVANVDQIDGASWGTHVSGMAPADLRDIAGSAVSTSSAQLGVNVVNAAGTAWASGALTSGVFASGAINRAALNADTGLQCIRSNTAQAGAGTSITLDASASASNNFYNNTLIVLTGGTGAGQARFITAYVGATKVATVATWTTNPDNTTTFAILPFDAVAGASAPTAAQNATAVWQDLLAGSDFGTASSIGALLKADIDAAISSRMATYSQPTGFLAATFPSGTVANTTNITAGTVTTATNLTNAPTAGDFTATMKTSIGTAVAASAVASVTGNVGGNVTGSVASVVDLSTSTLAEPSAPPSATDTIKNKLNWLCTLGRNKITQTATTTLVRNDGDSGTIGTSTVSDDATTFVRGKFS